ncbi:MAG TPA: ATP-binding protein, partial [Pseudomonadota bacterium]|nr:ATP-binding protein [Pseudomonadota bacterium]
RVLLLGDNATGKTALLKGLGLLRTLVLAGTRPGQPLPLAPCRLLPGEQPTHLELEVLHGGALWTYSLTASRELIEAESLRVGSGAAAVVMFSRQRPSALIPSTTIKLGEGVAGERERLQLVAGGTRAEQPFLGEALRRGSVALQPLGGWLREQLQLVRAEAKIAALAARCAREPDFARFLGELLAAAGTGISEVATTHRRVDPDYFETAEEKQQVLAALTGYADGFVQTEDGEIIAERDGRFVDLYQVGLRVLQRGAAGAPVELPLAELSDGVLRLLHLAPVLYRGGGAAAPVFFVDELDRSLHPRVTRQLLAQFAQSSESAEPAAADPGGAQLIATTHDAALLTAVSPAEVRVLARATPGPDRAAPVPVRLGPPPADLGSEELARRFVAGTLTPADPADPSS